MWNDTVIETVRRWPGDTLTFEPLGIQRLPTTDNTQRQQAIDTLLTALKHRPFDERDTLVEELARNVDAELPSPMMTTEQVRGLYRGGMGVGGHTRRHPILTVLPDEHALAEIRDGKQDLEAILDTPIELFAYPNGRPDHDYTTRHVRMVKELGFEAAVSTAWAPADGRSDRFQLPRFTPWDRGTPGFLARLAYNRQRVGA
jgi:peptidoglycan/xylan/chitin deacetylase (PgdA/CDA1 family)